MNPTAKRAAEFLNEKLRMTTIAWLKPVSIHDGVGHWTRCYKKRNGSISVTSPTDEELIAEAKKLGLDGGGE